MADDFWQSLAFLPGSTGANWISSNAGLGGDSTDPFGDKAAAAARLAQQYEALNQQGLLADAGRSLIGQQTGQALGYLQSYGGMGADALANNNALAQGMVGRGRGEAAGALDRSQYDALSSLSSGYAQGRGDIAGGYAQGRGDLAAGYSDARGDLARLQGLQGYGAGAARSISAYDVTGAQDRTGRLLDQRGGLYGGFESDPGYRFRQQQGEDAINRAASARGGRLSGRTLQELSEFNQGLASQEYGNFASRRQAEAGVAASSDAQRAALLQNQAGRTDHAALAAQANQMSLAGMGYGAQGQLAQLAAQRGQGLSGLSAAGGQALGGMAYGYGGQRAGMQSQHGRGLADLYTQTYGQQAGMQSQHGQSLADLYNSIGSNMSNAATAGSALTAGLYQNQMQGWNDFASGGNSDAEAEAANRKNIASIIASIFSDLRLKSNVQPKPSKYERIGLRGYAWKWNELAERKFGLAGESSGVMAHEVSAKYPAAVHRDPSGYLRVDYSALDRLVAEVG